MQPLDKARLIKYSPLTGTATRILIHFPAGCQSLVEVFVYYKRHQIFPWGTTGIALDDATQTFVISQEAIKNEPLEVLLINHDNVNPHTIVTTIQVVENEKETGT